MSHAWTIFTGQCLLKFRAFYLPITIMAIGIAITRPMRIVQPTTNQEYNIIIVVKRCRVTQHWKQS